MHRTSLRLACAALCALAATSLFASGAEAQGWLEDRERAEGPGFRLGDFELHPGLGAEIGYDSNVFYSDGNEADSGVLRITPHLYLSTLGAERSGDGEEGEATPPTIDFRLGVWGALYHYFATAARTDVEVGADMSATILPERPFSLTLSDQLSRGIRPFTEQGAANENYGRIRNDATARADFGTAGGVLKGHVGYTFGLDFFEGESFDYANNFTHSVLAGAAWKFLPSTALLYDFNLHYSTYPNDTAPSPILRADQTRLRARLGLNGAVTNRISLTALAGWAGGFYDAGDEYNDFVAQVELKWRITETARLSVGYDRDYNRSTFGNFVRRDRGFASVQLMLAGAVLVGVSGGVGFFDFGAGVDSSGAPLGAGGETDRSDIRVDASLFAEYRIQDWLALNGTVMYNGDFTDFEFTRDIGGTPMIDPAGWQKFQVWGGVRAFY